MTVLAPCAAWSRHCYPYLVCRMPEWELKGVTVVKVFSKRGEGYVQDVYAKAKLPLADPARTCVLVCGQKEMAEGVYEKMEADGVSRDNCLTNF